MRIIAPVTDYIPASVLTTLGDIVIRGVADPERLQEAGWRGYRIGYFMLDASENYTTPALGFIPGKVILVGCDDAGANLNFSIGFDDGTTKICIEIYNDGAAIDFDSSNSFSIQRDGGNHLKGEISNMGADTITFTSILTGACVARFMYMILP